MRKNIVQVTSHGSLQTRQNNNVHGVDWNANYDGNKANVAFKINDNGKIVKGKKQFQNGDLVNLGHLLSVPSVREPLDKRLFNDYISTPKRMNLRQQQQLQEPKIIRIRIDPELNYVNNEGIDFPEINDYEDQYDGDNENSLQQSIIDSFISSPRLSAAVEDNLMSPRLSVLSSSPNLLIKSLSRKKRRAPLRKTKKQQRKIKKPNAKSLQRKKKSTR